jgi:DNA repair protein RecN (Recombination protein N)
LLTHISIRNFALIEYLELRLGPGLNILTGETGAGKSIIIDAVGLIIGERASQEYIRTGSEAALVEAVFSLGSNESHVCTLLEEYGIGSEEEGELLISREISRSGKSVSRVNGRLITTTALRELGAHLIDIHGQNEHQSIMKAERHTGILDTFIGEAIHTTLADYRKLFRELLEIRKRQIELGGDTRERSRSIDLYEYQINEIDSAQLLAEEDVALEKERQIIANSEKLFISLEMAKRCLYEMEDSPSAMDLIGKAKEALATATGVDDNCRRFYESCEQLTYVIDDLIRDLNIYRESVEFDPDRIRAVEIRLDEIFQLKRKYGSSIEAIQQYREETAEKLHELKNSETLLKQITEDEMKIMAELGKKAEIISNARYHGAQALSAAVELELADLGMKNMQFQASVEQKIAENGIRVNNETFAFHIQGIDQIEFRLSTNPGEPVKPLIRIASGGEVSRIMLGIKAVLAFSDLIPTLIFDEIDSGIGGRAAQAVAKKLKKISTERQVLCVTHLPQIAAAADTHFHISKETVNERTGTRIEELDQSKRIAEIARMLSGDLHSETVIRHAEEMIMDAGKVNVFKD